MMTIRLLMSPMLVLGPGIRWPREGWAIGGWWRGARSRTVGWRPGRMGISPGTSPRRSYCRWSARSPCGEHPFDVGERPVVEHAAGALQALSGDVDRVAGGAE